MILQWNDKQLTTGDPALDQQHKELFRRVNDLHDAVIAGRGTDESRTLLDFLASYVTEHFAHEEALMACHNCPIAPANQEAHQQFAATFDAFRQRCERDGMARDVVLSLLDFVAGWLMLHICRVDMQIKPCLPK